MFPSIMRPAIVCLLLGTAWVAACRQPQPGGNDESVEPALRYVLTIDGKETPIAEGEAARVEGRFVDPVVRLSAPDFRVFSCGGVSFKYPRYFAFRAKIAGTDVKHWALTGNGCKIVFYVLPADVTESYFVDRTIELYGSENCRIRDLPLRTKMPLGVLEGTAIDVAFGEQSMNVEIYPVPTERPEKRFLVVHSDLDPTGATSEEALEAIELLRSSFVVNAS